MKKTLFAALAASFLLIACGDDDSAPIDARIVYDARPIDAAAPIDAAPAVCTMAAAVALPATMAGGYNCVTGSAWAACAGADPAASRAASMQGPVNADTLFDVLYIELWASSTVPIGSGTYTLTTAANSDYATCMQCVLGYTNINASTGANVDEYFQNAGTLQITAITPGTGVGSSTTDGSIAITLAGVTIEHVSILSASPWTSTPVGDGCESTVANGSITGTVREWCGEDGEICCVGNVCTDGTSTCTGTPLECTAP